MTDRIRLDDLTSDQLDQLYERLEAAEETESQRQLATAREALASATTRAARAEAAIARVRAVAGWAIQGWSDLSPQKVLLAVEGQQPASGTAATQATDDAVSDVVRKSLASFWTGAPLPREHCGHLSPETALTTPRTECVLRPGHTGSHADDVGCRWWPITEEPS
ncbi:hypothetical protein MQE23_08600 [Streptomyces sp. HP-A2021]|uniref:hypothetical protein n=1 Tax=Streptomyces sp. HP-A2021 TaxID=2927875 RepID=UPI001FAFCCE0|nr:hypothetical protein [Streptomyces sp. HP-A2021]UOB09111.1 hypothetical protein MQE23_08600 [Streptomyces sp. HP-A2021]